MTTEPSPNYENMLAYFLACLAAEDRPKASFFARSKFSPDYVAVPTEGSHGLHAIDGAQDLAKSTSGDPSKTLFVGGLPYLKHIKAKSGWQGFIVLPLLVAPVDVSDGVLSMDEVHPFISVDALRELSGGQPPTQLMEELLTLEQSIGLDAPIGAVPSISELVAALRQEQPEWPWQDGGEIPISRLKREGLYDRWVLFGGEKTVFTIGLSNDLTEMTKSGLPPHTALGHWFGVSDGVHDEGAPAAPDAEQTLLEPLPMNTEQRTAVELAMTQPLTVVTGPPGTGKSQVVTSILINAAYQGQTALFASKNNKAVDVVELRVNAIGVRPILLRLGAGDLQQRMVSYLTKLLATAANPTDRTALKTAVSQQKLLRSQQDDLRAELERVISARNHLDATEQSAESARELLGDSAFESAPTIDTVGLSSSINELCRALQRSQKARRSAFGRLVWPLRGSSRRRKLDEALQRYAPFQEELGFAPAPSPDTSVDHVDAYVSGLEARSRAVDTSVAYHDELAVLASHLGPDVLSSRAAVLATEVAANSAFLWDAWLATISDRIDAGQRKLLAQYKAVTKKLADGAWGKAVREQQAALFPKISRFLPTWAVTSLSVRNRVPFKAGFFDLVVIDEASQCDIASALPLLMRAKRAVVIGDPMQLRHVSKLHVAQDDQFMTQYNVADSPEWAYSSESLFDLAASLVPRNALVNLRDHHRSHADIIGFSNQEFYEGQLRVATHYDRLIRPNDEPAVRWIQVDGQVTTPSTGSSMNIPEAEAVVDELERLADQAYPGSVGVVTPFRPQATRIRDLAESRPGLKSFLKQSDFIVGAAHSFQGDERDVIIFSPVVGRGMSPGSMRFLASNPNLFNVAITRARAALIVVGDAHSPEIQRLSFLSHFADYVDGLESATPVDEAAAHDWGPKYPLIDGPPSSEWEHAFYEALYARGIKTTPQQPVEQYRLDLALVDGSRQLDIEVDGEHYHRAWDGELTRRDQLRNLRMIELGWDVMRFWVYQIRDDLEGSVARVEAWLAED